MSKVKLGGEDATWSRGRLNVTVPQEGIDLGTVTVPQETMKL
jgi:hypothetical protein